MVPVLAAAGGMAGALVAGSPAPHATGAVVPAAATGALVSVASPAGQFPENVQNMPALAVDPVDPGILAGAANDLVDMQPCSKGAAITAGACAFPATASGGGSFNFGVGMR